ncbi:MAG: hypothetical protein PHV71_03255 [Eubacteriales bacterium]|nr:hypothetical protein [Eubacteriales bacterium]MDD3198908.1 hypothetical protein [Eubacteriales bacterium]MDD4629605.1 hypothetical protein [Eubacteriales bacterium]
MKVFIVFIGMLIINMSFMSYQGDLSRFVRCQIYMKALAEECAAGASLYYDEAAYSEGLMYFRNEECRKYIDYIIKESETEMPLPKNSILTYEVSFEDDTQEHESKDNIPSVTVVITAKTGDVFGLPFLKVTEVERASKYELQQ